MMDAPSKSAGRLFPQGTPFKSTSTVSKWLLLVLVLLLLLLVLLLVLVLLPLLLLL